MTISIRKAKIDDSRAIRKLEQKVWDEKDVAGKYDIATIIRFGYAFIAKEGRKIIGAVLAIRTSDNCVYVEDWFVDKKYRGRGIGLDLYKRLMEETGQLPLVTLIHPSFKESLKAHEKLGFRVVKKVRDAYGIGDNVSRLLVKRDGI